MRSGLLPKLLGALTLCLLLATSQLRCAEPAAAVERIVKKDGSSIRGEVVGFEDGAYTVRADGRMIRVPAKDVYTIEDGRPAAHAEEAPVQPSEATIGVDRVMEELALRAPPSRTPADHVAIYHEACSAVMRGDWDIALKELERLRDAEPAWTAPDILAGILHAERGDGDVALGTALRLADGDDSLGRRVAAEIFRRTGFPRRSVEIRQALLSARFSGARLDYETAKLWWPLDHRRSLESWSRFRAVDGALEQSWCAEGIALRQIRTLIAAGEWSRAQGEMETLRHQSPWVEAELPPLRVEILTTRERAAEASAHLSEALTACHCLMELDTARSGKWRKRAAGLLAADLEQGLQLDGVDGLERWARDRGHLFVAGQIPFRKRLAARFLMLGMNAIASGKLEGAQRAIHAAETWGPAERLAAADTGRLSGVEDRLVGVLQAGRKDQAAAMLELVGKACADHGRAFFDHFARRARAALASTLSADEIDGMLAHLANVVHGAAAARAAGHDAPADAVAPPQAVAVSPAPPAPPPATPTETAEVHPTPQVTSSAAVQAYFPLAVGTVWVYRCGNGQRERRRLSAVTPLDDGGTRITFEVSGDGLSEPLHMSAFLEKGDLIFHHRRVPPGDIVLRPPLDDGASWSWGNGLFHYDRHLERPTAALTLPAGTFHDTIVVKAENRIQPRGPGKSYASESRFTFAAGVGLVRIESDDPVLQRVLLEYHPAPGAEPQPLESRK